MKKSAIFAAAFVLTLGLAQCKKEQPNAQISEGGTVHITVNVGASTGSATNGSRADIADPSNSGHYTFNQGDILYVGYNGAKVNGELTYNNGQFSGDITLEQNGDQPLHFYYLGGGAATQVGETQQYTVDISNQTSNYPVISYGTSTQNYSASLNSYTTTLLNQCALVEFTTNEIPTTTAVSISGMKNKVTVDFNGNTLTPSSEGTGSIKLHAESATSRWAILLANEEEVESTASAEGYDATGITIPAINNNDHWTQANGKNISFTMTEAASTNINLANVNSNTIVEDGAILTGTLGANVQISIADGATVTLNGVSINAEGTWKSDNYAGITCLGNATLILKDGSENTVRGFNEDYPGIYVPENHTLTIKGGAAGAGKLTASSNGYGAGIGSGYGTNCGAITISGGTVSAKGGEAAAGIGSAYEATCGAITITGGTVTATGGDSGAGIGSGQEADCGTITISGGTVTATGGGWAAGIGSGDSASCGTITITGGTVSANGGEDGAGIGSGWYASCGDITITTGVTKVTATKGGEYAPNSIGAGNGGSCGTVTIEPGANVTQN